MTFIVLGKAVKLTIVSHKVSCEEHYKANVSAKSLLMQLKVYLGARSAINIESDIPEKSVKWFPTRLLRSVDTI